MARTKGSRNKNGMSDEKYISICEMISTTKNSLNVCCRKHGITRKTFYNYLTQTDDNKLHTYARAREMQADIFFEEMLLIARKVAAKGKTLTLGKGGGETDLKKYLTHEGISANKLLIDTLKFAVVKLNPKKYGDTLSVSGVTNAPTLQEALGMLPDTLPEK